MVKVYPCKVARCKTMTKISIELDSATSIELRLEFFIFGLSLTYKTKFGKYLKYFTKSSAGHRVFNTDCWMKATSNT